MVLKHMNPILFTITGKKILRCALIVFSFGISLTCAASSTVLLDFGPTVVQPADATLDMGHFSGAVPSNEISWNQIQAADVTSGLVYSDGSPASGVSVVVGRSDAGVSNIVNFNNKVIKSSALGGAEKNGIYTNTSPTKDGIFANGDSNYNTNVVGVRIDGLAAGTYTLYISGRNTSTGSTSTERFFATNASATSSFLFSSDATPNAIELNKAAPPGSQPDASKATMDTFAYGDNCAALAVTLSANQSIYLAATGVAADTGFRGFLNAVEIVPGLPVLTNFPTTITSQPGNVSAYEGSTITMNAQVGGVPPLFYQWYSNSVPIISATNASLVLSNVTADMSANYNFVVSNVVNAATSSNAMLTIVPFFNTAQMTNIWNLLPGDRFYITADNNNAYERGLAYDPVTGDLLLVAHYPSNNIVVLNATNGAQKYFMNMDGIAAGAAGANMIGVADDGMVYVGNATVNAGLATSPYVLSQWADDASNTPGYTVFQGDPGYNTPAAGLRWGDNITVRGSGAGTQILAAPGSGTNVNYVCLFTEAGTGAFNPNMIDITNVPPSTNGFARFGIAFGPGTNTFWAKTLSESLFLVQFDAASGTGGVIYTASNSVPGGYRFISTDSNQKWMAGVYTLNSSLPDNVRLYDISAYTNGPVLADQELYATTNHSTFLIGAGTGQTVFGGTNYLFALDSNNGIKAFLINTGLLPYNITSIVPSAGANVVLTWQSVAGHSYQIQTRSNLFSGTWSDLGSPVTASGTQTSATNTIAQPAQFFRVKGQ